MKKGQHSIFSFIFMWVHNHAFFFVNLKTCHENGNISLYLFSLLNLAKYIAILCFRIIGSETPKGLGIFTLLVKVRCYMVVTLPSVRF